MSQDMYIYTIIVLSAVITYGTRALGFFGASFLKETSPIFLLTNYVSYALVGALVMQLLVTPYNSLASIPLVWRVLVPLVCVAIYVVYRKHLLVWILIAVATLTLAQVFII